MRDSQPGRSRDTDEDRSAMAGVDALLARVLRGEPASWPEGSLPQDGETAVLERIEFHGIAGLLGERKDALTGWPAGLLADIRQHAITQAMWEMGHKAAISGSIDTLADGGVASIILKGTALAYHLYPQPMLRARGDTDVLIDTADLDRTRSILSGLGFERETATDEMVEDLEETWAIEGRDHVRHKIDVHWQAMDAPALEGLLPYAECIAGAHHLERFGKSALRMDDPAMLLHAIVHRAKHAVTPYFVNGIAYHDGDRLIWIADFDLLGRALDPGGWSRFCDLALSGNVAPACLEALETAQRLLGTPVPTDVIERLQAAPKSSRESDYLLHDRQLGRAVKNFRALKGPGRKLSYLRSKILPSRKFMRDKYAHLPRVPVPLLYAWRILELFIRRPKQGGQ